MIVSELRGERIDVVPWSETPSQYVAMALSPAKVDRALINEESHTATVIVPDDQLSLAIGKEGQNARLAAKLTGWRIDIKSASVASEQGLYQPSSTSSSGSTTVGGKVRRTLRRCHFHRRALPQQARPRVSVVFTTRGCRR
jgi:transcription antitermination factor NusA-like protein